MALSTGLSSILLIGWSIILEHPYHVVRIACGTMTINAGGYIGIPQS